MTDEQMDALLEFLPRLGNEEFDAGRWHGEEGELPWMEHGPLVRRFVEVAYATGWVIPDFNWMEWQEQAKRIIDQPRQLTNIELETIRRLMTTHLRADRFCEGHLASVFESGHIRLVLERLAEIRGTRR